MRVTYLYYPTGNIFSRSARVSIYFYGRLQELCDLTVFGPGTKYHWFKDNYNIYPYRDSMTLQDIVRETRADVLLFGGARSIQAYNDFKTNVPNVLLLNEYFTLKPYLCNYVRKIGRFFDLSITRVRPNLQDFDIPARWLPFSANDEEFYTEWSPDYLEKRQRKIIYRGTLRGQPPYDIRRKAIELLKGVGLLGPPASGRNYATRIWRYPRHLKRYVGGLSCAWSSWGETPLKTFEIMASGTCLLTQQFNRVVRRELFDNREDLYVTYEDDCKDIIKKAEGILYNIDKTKEITKNALEVINDRHLDKHRVKELYEILKALVGGQEIPRRWRYEE